MAGTTAEDGIKFPSGPGGGTAHRPLEWRPQGSPLQARPIRCRRGGACPSLRHRRRLSLLGTEWIFKMRGIASICDTSHFYISEWSLQRSQPSQQPQQLPFFRSRRSFPKIRPTVRPSTARTRISPAVIHSLRSSPGCRRTCSSAPPDTPAPPERRWPPP